MSFRVYCWNYSFNDSRLKLKTKFNTESLVENLWSVSGWIVDFFVRWWFSCRLIVIFVVGLATTKLQLHSIPFDSKCCSKQFYLNCKNTSNLTKHQTKTIMNHHSNHTSSPRLICGPITSLKASSFYSFRARIPVDVTTKGKRFLKNAIGNFIIFLQIFSSIHSSEKKGIGEATWAIKSLFMISRFLLIWSRFYFDSN
jgi:hypothetical protein